MTTKQNWKLFFQSIKNKKYVKDLKKFLDFEYQNYKIFPPRNLIFNAFRLTPINKIKIVILGQDPYFHNKQAMGLSFSVPKNVIIPPSLKNIFKEIKNEFKCNMDFQNGDLTYLAKQGCLLLNTILTVRESKPLSHKKSEYEKLIIDILKYINKLEQPIVFMLWGLNAKKYKSYIDTKDNFLILESVHPSSYNSENWFWNGNFKDANIFLKKNNLKEIDWSNVKK